MRLYSRHKQDPDRGGRELLTFSTTNLSIMFQFNRIYADHAPVLAKYCHLKGL